MQELKLPKRGQAMEEGLILEWTVDEGEQVSAGDTVVVFETEKTTAEIEAEQDGTLIQKLVDAGETVPIGTTLGYVGTEDEAGDAPTSDRESRSDDVDTDGAETAVVDADGTDATEQATTATTEAGTDRDTLNESSTPAEAAKGDADTSGIVRASPSARKTARSHGVDVDVVGAELGMTQVSSDDVERYVRRERNGREIRGSPAARRVADEEGVRIEAVGEAVGTDRVRLADLETYTAETPAKTTSEPQVEEERTFEERSVKETVPITGGRKVMFDRMQTVSSEYGSTTTIARVDVTELMDLLDSLEEPWNEHHGVSPSLTAFVVRAVAESLPNYRMLNAEIETPDGGDAPPQVTQFEDVNVGLAVDTDHGLLVPTLYGADEASVVQLCGRIADVARQAREQSLDYEQQQNATFTVSNAGTFGAYINTPRINPPQTGILGVCTVNEEPGIVDGEVVPRKFVHLSLTYDHRVVEGSTAVQFLQSVKRRLESPGSLLQ